MEKKEPSSSQCLDVIGNIWQKFTFIWFIDVSGKHDWDRDAESGGGWDWRIDENNGISDANNDAIDSFDMWRKGFDQSCFHMIMIFKISWWESMLYVVSRQSIIFATKINRTDSISITKPKYTLTLNSGVTTNW